MTKQYTSQICLKLAGQLRAAVEDDAAVRQRSVSWVIRRLLVDHYAQRITDRANNGAAADVRI
jgi:hypothetical protein